jgi:threonine/homoserine/homoserine lactone efflux protein
MEIMAYLNSFGKGLLLGLLLMISVGPVFFAVINASIGKGFKTAIYFIAGVTLSDMLYIVLTNFGAVSIITTRITYVNYIGGGVLIVYGIVMFLKKYHAGEENVEINRSTHWKYLAKGFLINTTTPGVVLFWTANAVTLAAQAYTRMETVFYFIGVLTLVNVADVSKAYFARKLKTLLSPKNIVLINRISGIGMLIFGLILLYAGFKG